MEQDGDLRIGQVLAYGFSRLGNIKTTVLCQISMLATFALPLGGYIFLQNDILKTALFSVACWIGYSDFPKSGVAALTYSPHTAKSVKGRSRIQGQVLCDGTYL